jgi:mRNA interferase YafQ
MVRERKLVLTKAFEKSYQKFTSKNTRLKNAIHKTLSQLQADAFSPLLKTHKLSGKLAAYLACSCGYDCRIIFTIEKDLLDPGFENIILLDIGTHEDVY